VLFVAEPTAPRLIGAVLFTALINVPVWRPKKETTT
jgi:hypothetical protein